MKDTKKYTPEHIEISGPLLEYLTPAKNDNPYSRCDAFLDLMDRASCFIGHLTYLGYDFDLHPGEFVVTFTELSQSWKWHRRTVRLFIEELRSLGLLQVVSYKKFYHFDMVALKFSDGDENKKSVSEDVRNAATEDPHEEIKDCPLVSLAYCPFDDTNEKSPSSGSLCRRLAFTPVDTRLYSAAQRIETAEAILNVVYPQGLSFLADFYSPRVEKTMLDLLYKHSRGRVGDFKDCVKSLAERVRNEAIDRSRALVSEVLGKTPESPSDATEALKAEDSTAKPPKAKRTRKSKAKQ